MTTKRRRTAPGLNARSSHLSNQIAPHAWQMLLQDVDELLLGEAQDAHGRLRWLARDVPERVGERRPAGEGSNRDATGGLNPVGPLSRPPVPRVPRTVGRVCRGVSHHDLRNYTSW